MNARHINTDTPLRYALAIGDAVTREIASPGGCRSPERRLAANEAPARFAYADPPYPGRAKKHYGCAETDYPALVARLQAGGSLGWALSTSEDSLRWLLPLCPEGTRVCPWVKPQGVPRRSFGLHKAVVARGEEP